MVKCNFNPFLKNTSGWLLMKISLALLQLLMNNQVQFVCLFVCLFVCGIVFCLILQFQ